MVNGARAEENWAESKRRIRNARNGEEILRGGVGEALMMIEVRSEEADIDERGESMMLASIEGQPLPVIREASAVSMMEEFYQDD